MTIEDVQNLPVKQYSLQDRFKCDGIYNKVIKRALDLFISGVAILILWPILGVLALLIWKDSGKPILYKPLRGGYHNKPFHILKFRTMVPNADQIGGGTTAQDDPRITRIGKLLRKMKVDELPQLFNVFAGDMSLIGPRPELLKYTEAYDGVEKRIHDVRPGITDLGCVMITNLDEICGSENADAMYEKYVLSVKNALRVQYAAEVSLWIDLKIIGLTVSVVVNKYIIKYFKDHKKHED